MTLQKNGRLAWADTLRALAIYIVVLAHLGPLSQRISIFCFTFVMQLFFFVSGLFASHYTSLSFGQLCKKIARRMLLPHLTLCVINIIYSLFADKPDLLLVIHRCIMAVRGRIPFSTLWYLPCLAVMTVLYHLLCRLVQNASIRGVLCLAVSVLARLFLEGKQWFWSADTALMLLFYYAAGDLLMPLLQKHSFASLKAGGKVLFLLLTLFSAALCLYGWRVINYGDPLGIIQGDVASKLFYFVFATSAICICVVLARLLQPIKLLQTLGRHTVVLFGIQRISDALLFELMWALGIVWTVRLDWQTLFYGAAHLLFACFAIAVPLYRLVPELFGGVRKRKPAVTAAQSETL